MLLRSQDSCAPAGTEGIIFPRDNVVSQGETSIMFGIYLITLCSHNKDMVIGG